jgi:hypothetical protein
VASQVVHVCEPNRKDVYQLHAIYNLFIFPHVIGDKPHTARKWPDTRPKFVLLDELENILVMKRAFIPDNQKPLFIMDKLRHILTEQGERRIGNDNIRLLQQIYALAAAKVAAVIDAIAIKRPGRVGVALEQILHIGEVSRTARLWSGTSLISIA